MKIEFYEKNIKNIGIITNGTIYYYDKARTHKDILEHILNFEFKTSDVFYDFLKNSFLAFVYFFPNNIIVCSSYNEMNIGIIIKVILENNIPCSKLYKKENFDSSFSESEYKLINLNTLKLN